MTDNRPLILLTNDDGVFSPGLRVLARTLCDLGEILIAAPRHQQSSTGHSLGRVGAICRENIGLDVAGVTVYSVEATPSMAARVGVMLLAQRPIALAISGINYGENVGVNITTSGTVGAAQETASFGIPSIAASVETSPAYHFAPSEAVDFTVAAGFTRRVAGAILARPLPSGIDIVKVDVPDNATPATPWQLTRLTRQRYYESVIQQREDGSVAFDGYRRIPDLSSLEPDSDAYALLVNRAISVCPLTLDQSASMNRRLMADWFAL